MQFVLHAFGAFLLAVAIIGGALGEPGTSRPTRPVARADDKVEPKGSEEDLNKLGLEIAALKILADLDPTAAQLKALGEMATETAAKMGERKKTKSTPKLRSAVVSLREALIENDPDAVKSLTDKVEGLRETDGTYDDDVPITDGARAKAPAALRLFGTQQISDYIASYGEDLPDPVDRVLETIDEGLKLTGKEWEQLRDEAVGDTSWQFAGLDAEKSAKKGEQIKAFLDEAHGLKEADLKAQRSDLEKKIRTQILAPHDASVVLQHIMQHDLAILLSNPQVASALQARLQQVEKSKD